MDIFGRLFGHREAQESKSVAKERLRLVLVHDRAKVAPQIMEMLKEDIVRAISRYMDIDEKGMEINIDRGDTQVALSASIPIVRVKRGYLTGEMR